MIVCADDFGLRPDIDQAILELCTLNKLSAVSCMTLFDGCGREQLRKLQSFAARVDIGLHLCLTAEPGASCARKPLGFASFRNCLWRTGTRSVQKREVLAEIAAQYGEFNQKTGHAPAHIDGHLHIHQIPVVREALIEFVKGLPESTRPYIRNTTQNAGVLRKHGLPFLKALSISLLGRLNERRLHSAGLETNYGFAGVYDFRNYLRFPEYLPRFVKVLRHTNAILVVHPGKSDPWRLKEFETLRADRFSLPNRFRPTAT